VGNILKREAGTSTFIRTGSHLTCEWWKFKGFKKCGQAFNNLFVTVTEKLNIQQVEEGDAISILEDSFPGNFPSIKIILITKTE
jgi:hypothetical protein